MTTLETLRIRCGIDSADTADDALLARLIVWATGLMQARCNRTFARAEDITHEFRADELCLVLPRYPVEEITAWEVRSSSLDSWAAVTDPAHHLDQAAGIVDFPGSPLGSRSERARITFTGGYVMPGATAETGQTALPGELEQAALEQCLRWYRDKDRLGLTGVNSQGSVSTPAGLVLLPDVLTTLEPYRRFNI
jgi:hypothetical protein